MADASLIRPGLWVVDSEVEDFTVRAALVTGRHGAVLFDTLAQPSELTVVGDLLGDLPVTVVYSHGDWDHIWGTSGLGDRPGEVLAHRLCARRFQEDILRTLSEKQAGEDARGSNYQEVVLIPPTRTFRDQVFLDLGDVTVELSHIPGHTLDSVVGFIPEWRVFLAGDAVEVPVPFLNPESPLDQWIRSLELWEERLEEEGPCVSPVLVIPSHGPPGGPELLSGTLGYLKDLVRGTGPRVPEELSPFYAETHASNLELGRAWRRRHLP